MYSKEETEKLLREVLAETEPTGHKPAPKHKTKRRVLNPRKIPRFKLKYR